MSNVQKLYPANAAENPDNVLEQAVGVYEKVLVLGFDREGALDCRGSLNLTDDQAVFLVEAFKHQVLANGLSE